MKLGLKIWSINHQSFEKLDEFFQKGLIDYVELYTYPDSFDASALSPLKKLPLIFHAPTFPHGMNLASPFREIKALIQDIRQYTSFFQENKIIFHPGVMQGSMRKSLENTISNLNYLKNEFDIILENVPAIGIDDKSVMVGATPWDFMQIKNETQVKSCLDFGHAINSANYHQTDPFEYIEQFLREEPFMFHLSDGNFDSHIDVHLHYHQGSFPLERIVSFLPGTAIISLETPKKDFKNLSEDHSNLILLKKFFT